MRGHQTRRRIGARAAFGVVALVLVAVPALAFSAGSFRVVLASQNSQGVRANGDSSTQGTQLVSGDGRLVAFDSTSTNLPGGDGSIGQVYVRDFATGKTRIVSLTNGGDPAG